MAEVRINADLREGPHSNPQRFPVDDFVTLQGQASNTFRRPNLDGSLTLAMLVDWHAIHSANHPYAVFPEQGGSLRWINFAEFGAAVNRATRFLKNSVTGSISPRSVVGLLAARDHLTYLALLFAIMKIGCIPFPLSARNSSAGTIHLIQNVDVKLLLTSDTETEGTLSKDALAACPCLQLVGAPYFEDLFDTTDLIEEYKLEAPSDIHDVSMYLHSSGSTAFPKPIPLSHYFILTLVRSYYYSYHDFCGEINGCSANPPFHLSLLANMSMYPFGSGIISAIYTPQRPPIVPNFDNLLRLWEQCKCTMAVAPPTYLVSWSKESESMQYLRTLKQLAYSGGPLPTEMGNRLIANGVKLHAIWGATETGNVDQSWPKGFGEPTFHFQDWEYTESFPHLNIILLPQDENGKGYEICFGQSQSYQPSIFNDHERKMYRTNDVVERHPAHPRLFKVVGRADDQIMLSTGEKTNPGPLEKIIGSHPDILNILYFGRARFQNGILVQPAAPVDIKDEQQVAAFRNQIWTVVEKANDYAPSHSRIFKEMILICPKDRGFAMTPKGTVSRTATLKIFESAIDDLYESVQTSSGSTVVAPQSFDDTSITRFVHAIVSEILGKPVLEAKDLFEQGCDSLQATFIRNRIVAGLGRKISISPNFVYQHSSVVKLSQALLRILKEPGTALLDPVDPAAAHKRMAKYAKEYNTGLPEHHGIQKAPQHHTALLTGASGTLGVYLLNELLQNPSVERVYALTRFGKTSASSKLEAALLDRGLDPNLLSSKKLTLVEADLAKPQMGLSDHLYQTLVSQVTVILANAWSLNFNLSLDAFEPNMRGIRNLMELAKGSMFETPPRIVTSSSIGLVLAYQDGWVPEACADPAWCPHQGYAQSKWVAEEMLTMSNLPVTNVRICQLAGSTINGAWNITDWIPMLTKSAERLKCLPDGSGPVTFVPTDMAAKIMIEISLFPSPPTTVHLVHPRPTTWHSVVQVLALALGVPLVPYAEWLDKLARDDDIIANPAVKLLPFFQNTSSDALDANHESFGAVRLHSRQAETCSPTLAHLQALTPQDVLRWLEYWQKNGFLLSR